MQDHQTQRPRYGYLRKPEAQAEAGVNAPQRIVNDSEAAASVLAKVRVIRGSSSITQALASLSERGSGGAVLSEYRHGMDIGGA